MSGNFGEPLLYEARVSKRCPSEGTVQLLVSRSIAILTWCFFT